MVGVFFLLPLGLVFWMSAEPLARCSARRRSTSPTTTRGSPTTSCCWTRSSSRSSTRRSSPSCCRRWRWGSRCWCRSSGRGDRLPAHGVLPARRGRLRRRVAAVLRLLQPRTGRSTTCSRPLGLVDEPVRWLGTPNAALFSTIAMVIWRFAGFNMLILLTGLQAIPTGRLRGGADRRREPLADLPPHHAAAAAADDRADARAQHHRLAAGVRPVLHPDPRRPGRQHDEHRDGDLPRGVHALRPRLRRRRSRWCCWSCSCVLNVLQLRVLRRERVSRATDARDPSAST